MDMIGLLENNLEIKANIDFKPMQPGDVVESFADIGISQGSVINLFLLILIKFIMNCSTFK